MPGMPALHPESGGTMPSSASTGPPPRAAIMPLGGKTSTIPFMPTPHGQGIPPAGGESIPSCCGTTVLRAPLPLQ